MSIGAIAGPVREFNETVQGAGNAVRSGFDVLGFVFQALIWGPIILLGGGWLLNNFHDQPWLRPVMEFFAPMVEGLLNFLPEGMSDWLRENVLGNFAQYMTGAGARAALQMAGLSEDMTRAMIRDGETESAQDIATLNAALAAGRNGATGRVARGDFVGMAFNEHSLSYLLNDPNGRRMLNDARAIAIREAQLADQTYQRSVEEARANNRPIPARPQNHVLNAVRGLLNNSTLFAGVRAEGLEVMYQYAEALGNVTLSTEAKAALNGLGAEQRRQLFAAFIPAESAEGQTQMRETVARLISDSSDTRIPDATLFTIIRGVTVTSNAEAQSLIQRMTTPPVGSSVEPAAHFAQIRAQMQALGVDTVIAFANNPVQALVANANNTNLNGPRLSALASLAPTEGPGALTGDMRSLLSTPEGAQSVIDLAKTLEVAGAGTFERFVNALGAFNLTEGQLSALQTPNEERAAALDAVMAQYPELLAIYGANKAAIDAFINAQPADSSIRRRAAPLQSLSAETATASAGILRQVNEGTRGNEALRASINSAFQQAIGSESDFTPLMGLLFQDDPNNNARALVSGENNAILENLARLAGQQVTHSLSTPEGYGEQTVRAFLTGNGVEQASAADGRFAALAGHPDRIGTYNLEALVTLIDSIDRATGREVTTGDEAAKNAAEVDADARNLRLVNFFLQVSTGQEVEMSQTEREQLYDDIQRRLQSTEVVAAIRTFFNTVDVDNMTPAQQRLMDYIKDNWWIDRSPEGETPNNTFESWAGINTTGNIFMTALANSGLAESGQRYSPTDDKDLGIAAILSDPYFRESFVNGLLGVETGGMLDWMRAGVGEATDLKNRLAPLRTAIDNERPVPPRN
ncbi:MAG: hypothetical protein J0M34_06525 [Alphaproteobacteria bacterium]|nr:hypothetical protein [Alphaproteobacteria bacterium]